MWDYVSLLDLPGAFNIFPGYPWRLSMQMNDSVLINLALNVNTGLSASLGAVTKCYRANLSRLFCLSIPLLHVGRLWRGMDCCLVLESRYFLHVHLSLQTDVGLQCIP